MGRRAKNFDWTFGADVVQLHTAVSHVVRDVDGRSYDLSGGHGGNLDIAKVLAAAFQQSQSKNENPESRKRTNRGTVAYIQRFTRWSHAQGAISISASLLADFRNHLSATAAASTAYSVYAVVVRFVRLLMANNKIVSFPIPSTFSHLAIEASLTGTGASFASALEGHTYDAGIDEFNEASLSCWIKAAWCEIDALGGRINCGREWRQEVDEKWRPPSWFLGLREIAHLSREDVMVLCKSICISHLSGRTPNQLPSPPQDCDRKWGRVVRAIISEFKSWSGEEMTMMNLKEAIANAQVKTVPVPDWATDADWNISGTRQECLKLVVQLMQKRFKGLPPEVWWAKKLRGVEKDVWVKALNKIKSHTADKNEAIFSSELASYFHPGPIYAALALSLICAAQINPSSAIELTVDCLETGDSDGMTRLKWRKERAGGEQLAIPFPAGGLGSKSIPRLVERVLDATSEIRSFAVEADRDRLFLWNGGGASEAWCKSFRGKASCGQVWNHLRCYLEGTLGGPKPSQLTTEALAPLVKHLWKINPALIRATAINIASARSHRDMRVVADMDGRRGIGTLDKHYLNNPQTRDALDRQVREGQASMTDWMRQPPIVMAPDEGLVAAELNVDKARAQSIVNEELNLGMGACLVDGRAVFLDTPVNCLRVIQWLRHMSSAKQRMGTENPARWTAIFAPQITLFTQALQAFSRPTRAAAEEMDSEFILPFPSIH